MYKLLSCIIIYLVGSSVIAQAQTVNDTKAAEPFFNTQSKHFIDLRTTKNVVEYKSMKNTAHSKNKVSDPSLEFYKLPVEYTGDKTRQHHVASHKKKIPNDTSSNLKYVRIKKPRISTKTNGFTKE